MSNVIYKNYSLEFIHKSFFQVIWNWVVFPTTSMETMAPALTTSSSVSPSMPDMTPYKLITFSFVYYASTKCWEQLVNLPISCFAPSHISFTLFIIQLSMIISSNQSINHHYFFFWVPQSRNLYRDYTEIDKKKS